MIWVSLAMLLLTFAILAFWIWPRTEKEVV
jgi:hypothetical protein